MSTNKHTHTHTPSPTSDGSACAIVCSEDFVNANRLHNKAVEILAIEMATDLPSTFNEQSCMKLVSRQVVYSCKALTLMYEPDIELEDKSSHFVVDNRINSGLYRPGD